MDDYKTHINNGDKLMDKEKYMDAIREYSEAYKIMQPGSEKAELCYKLSQAYLALDHKNIENPVKYAKEALEEHERSGEMELKILDLMNLGYIYLDSNRDEALKYIENAYRIADEIKDVQLKAMALNAKAEAINDNNEALKIYRNVMEISEKSNDWDNYFEAALGEINILRDNDINSAMEAAYRAMDKIDKILETIKTKKERTEFKKSLSYIYDSASDMAMELENFDEAMKIAERAKS
ncbi:hypothetical protein [Picrophilus oshimae]|uniref:Tetratricopeptide repeat-containing protein n=1 Tax=Picrophilus torridus (strain ATCC 700027 / DSM 9790 / JCM 10055 / NBRC 100828 / KAW 2/3) TaxID=1122961 RepID=A0A8G2FXJ0_PICTO|nr:hypothetical protein [Picrophilus oshimae]SMD31352.1 hypothetical protein SAMN02745355_1280 [Picrophilus oshimae DSM 9789]